MAKITIQGTDSLKNSRSNINANFDELYTGANIDATTEKTTPVDDDLFGLLDSAASYVLKKLTWANLKATIKSYIMPIIYPVGSVYINATDNTNPATLFGFGTWAAFGAGRVPVGYNSGDSDFNAAEKTGGAKTHTLTAAESGLPSHQHGIKTGGASGGSMFYKGNTAEGVTDDTDGGSNAVSTQYIAAANASASHNNLQPYITVFMWKRTA